MHDQQLERILQLLERQPYWRSRDLARELGVSRSTVQRCLQELQDRALAERIHGGVRRMGLRAGAPIGLDERSRTDLEAKAAIAETAAAFVPDAGFVYLDAGTTVLPLAQALPAPTGGHVQVVTNDPAIAGVLAGRSVPHILLGGSVHPVTRSISGPLTQEQVAGYHFDVCFLSVDGVSADDGVTCAAPAEAALKRDALGRSDRRVLLAPAAKWRRRSGVVISPLSDIDALIMERAPADARRACKRLGVDLHLPACTHTKKGRRS